MKAEPTVSPAVGAADDADAVQRRRAAATRRRHLILAGIATLALIGASTVVWWDRHHPPEQAVTPPEATSAPVSGSTGVLPKDFGPYPTFGARSVFTADVSHAPTHPRSADITARLVKSVEENWGGIAPFNTGKYAAGYAVATEGTQPHDVTFTNCQNKGQTPSALFSGPAIFAHVPIPADAVAAAGSDHHLAVYDPATDRLWEFWVASRRDDATWQACWGGLITKVSSASGQFEAPYGVSASGLAVSGLMVTLEDVRRGRIEHAMGLTVIEAALGHSYPANRDDGYSTRPDAIKEGTRLRLDPALDVDALSLSPIGHAVAKAAQRYGFIVTDKGGAVAVIAESGDRWAKRTGTNPWPTLRGSTAQSSELKGFPWDRIQVIQEDWGRPPRQ
ncbi:hypothetical protein KEM60_00764 [Austwickia sp. TVS 96-490-7B]|uniref:hypothetical protein n=1 Tax=Austwickia sp. TVS 96-490-7B TaxID=2830843 RepID=UPI001C5741EA|nr:hypothetical protein [Austwickia sp. TVS 96-490-7B]MBW3084576.1 hypothetical protein [Austwickia sp. TVS 96-490-7B]